MFSFLSFTISGLIFRSLIQFELIFMFGVKEWSNFTFLHVVQWLSCVQLLDPMDCSTPSFPVLHYLPEFSQTNVHWVNNAIPPSHPLSPPFPPALNLSQHQSLSQWAGSLHQVVKVFTYSCPFFTATFLEETVFPTLCSLASFVIH